MCVTIFKSLPLLNALTDPHKILCEGQHTQYPKPPQLRERLIRPLKVGRYNPPVKAAKLSHF